MGHNKNDIKKIAENVQSEYQMGGLADGIYLDFAIDVAIKYYDFKSNLDSKDYHITLVSWLINELENEKIITPTQRSEIRKYLEKKYERNKI